MKNRFEELAAFDQDIRFMGAKLHQIWYDRDPEDIYDALTLLIHKQGKREQIMDLMNLVNIYFKRR